MTDLADHPEGTRDQPSAAPKAKQGGQRPLFSRGHRALPPRCVSREGERPEILSINKSGESRAP